MLAILKKEINSFFASPIGYLVISLFLVVTGLFLWVFEGEFNIPNSGFADLAPFFQLAPWIFTFLIPAITMRSFSEEQKTGTLELLLTKPISTLQLVLGKYFGALVLMIITIIPTLIYVVAIYQLGNPVGNLDIGVTIGSYLGLILLAASFIAMGIYASTLSDNQIVAFILAVLFCFVFYFGIDGLASYTSPLITNLGMQTHYDSISRGVIDSRDVIYFVSIIAFFIYLTKNTLEKKR
ncbi:gliding motility-associated ABC transporter permease subunit GldF [uncultured Dokdonia sp.]|uniref:gliding motility-associated ABC transporter permease subunit GldF n=1 Tax=uncultured Dokdonia sp. TaxID=575653 RepID=UPI00261EA31E|nr:gliding motility-associated ABC transporter permease subunit GldF [uncultured Dokdonia sp.]